MVPERKRKPKRKATLLLIIFFAGVAAAAFFTSPLSKVRTIEVVGNNQIPEEQILSASGLQKGMNIWAVDPSEVDKRMKSQLPLLSKADVEVNFPGHVVIAVAEKPVAAILAKGVSYYRLLSDGTVYDMVKNPGGTGLPLLTTERQFPIEIGKQIPDPEVQKFCSQIVQVDRSILEHISEINIKQGELWSAWTISPEKFEIRFPPGDISTTLDVYINFWKKQLAGKSSGIIYIYSRDEAWYSEEPRAKAEKAPASKKE